VPETGKGNQYYFGIKAHIGTDDESDLVHSGRYGSQCCRRYQVDKLLHGEENRVGADADYTGVEKRPEHEGQKVIWQVAARRSTYKKLDKRSALYQAKRKIGKAKARVRIKVEHPFRVIMLDLKGFGDSPKPRDDAYSVYEQARLVRNFILENDLKHLHVIGHSYGGGVALVTSVYLSASNPGLQKSLVLIDSMAYPQELPSFIKILATPVLGPLVTYGLPDAFQVKNLLQKVYFDDALIPQDAIDHYAANQVQNTLCLSPRANIAP